MKSDIQYEERYNKIVQSTTNNLKEKKGSIMSEYVLTNGIVYTENEMINNGYVHIKDGKILDVGKCPFHPSSSHNTIDIIDVKHDIYCLVL